MKYEAKKGSAKYSTGEWILPVMLPEMLCSWSILGYYYFDIHITIICKCMFLIINSNGAEQWFREMGG